MDQVENVHSAYHTMKHDVEVMLRTQVGDETCLRSQAKKVLEFFRAAEQVSLYRVVGDAAGNM